MLLFVKVGALLGVCWLLFLLDDDEAVVLEVSHLFVVEGGSEVLFLFFVGVGVSLLPLVVFGAVVASSTSAVVAALVLGLLALSGLVGALVVGLVGFVSVLFLGSALLFGFGLAFSSGSRDRGSINLYSRCLFLFGSWLSNKGWFNSNLLLFSGWNNCDRLN